MVTLFLADIFVARGLESPANEVGREPDIGLIFYTFFLAGFHFPTLHIPTFALFLTFTDLCQLRLPRRRRRGGDRRVRCFRLRLHGPAQLRQAQGFTRDEGGVGGSCQGVQVRGGGEGNDRLTRKKAFFK